MFKKIILQTALSVMLLLLSNINLFAQERRVTFAKGKTSATASGTIDANTCGETFTVRVKKGQRVRMSVTSTNGQVGFDESCSKSFSVVMNETTDYPIIPCNCGRRATRFTLTVSVR
ncbi:MAG TPA: hypothetical protein VGB00_04680 [Pyrinomonadaceae bacterium]|jgi:hypothetical protein